MPNGNGEVHVKPVINLKASVLVENGNGTQSNPYTVKLS